MSTWLAAAIAAGAIIATYLSCVRPHLRARARHAPPTSSAQTELDRQLTDLRDELRMLRAQDQVDTRRMSGGGQASPGDSKTGRHRDRLCREGAR
jgi:hypothetical protein